MGLGELDPGNSWWVMDWDFSGIECRGSFGVWELQVAEAGSGREVGGFGFGTVMRR